MLAAGGLHSGSGQVDVIKLVLEPLFVQSHLLQRILMPAAEVARFFQLHGSAPDHIPG